MHDYTEYGKNGANPERTPGFPAPDDTPSQFSKSQKKTPFPVKDLNILLFPDETKVLFVLVVLLSIAGVLRMLLFFPDLFSEFSRSVFATYIYLDRNVSFLILIPFLILALLIYVLRPWYLIYKEGMVRLDEKEPAISAKISELSGHLKLVTPVTALLSPESGITIHTFGTHRQHYIVMNRGFIDKFLIHDDEFRAVLCHELAHIRSGDVERTELALAFLCSFFCFAFVFLAMGMALIVKNYVQYGADLGAAISEGGSSRPLILNPVLQNFITNFSTGIVVSIIVGIAIWFLIRFIIQYRELYADWMTTQMMGERMSLERALTRMQAVARFQAGAKMRENRHGFFPHLPSFILPRYHPTIRHREEFLDNPGKFFSPGLSMLFIIGFSVAWFYQLTVLYLGLFQIPPGLDSQIIPVFIPGVLLAAALLLPRLTAQVLIPHEQRTWHSNPVVVSQIFMLGFASVFYLIQNIGLVLDEVVHKVLLISSPAVFSMSYSYHGMNFPTYHPAMALIMGEFVSVSILGILLISLAVTHLLAGFISVRWLFRHPILSLLLLPVFFASAIVVIALTGNPVPALGLLFMGLLVLLLACRKCRKCPVCATPFPGNADHGVSCPACGFDTWWWIKNAK